MSNAIRDDWYRAKRQSIEPFFLEQNRIADSEKTHASPSGKYRLCVTGYATKPGCWNYMRGEVFAGDTPIVDVKRNYSVFHFGWAEGHSNGHDYLLCGEDYQGQTVIELDTGRRADHICESARGGGAFCCAAYHPSPDRKLIVIDGCHWACPYELVVFRFDDPMRLPWPEVERLGEDAEVRGWTDEGFVYDLSEYVRLSDGQAYDAMTEAEQEDFWKRLKEVGGERKRRYLWTPSGEGRILDERIERSA